MRAVGPSDYSRRSAKCLRHTTFFHTTYSSVSVEFGIKGYYDAGRNFGMRVAETPTDYRVMFPSPLFVAPTLQTDGRTDVMIVASSRHVTT